MSLSVDLTPARSTISAEALLEVAEDPEKFRAILENLKAEQAKLDAKIRLVGPAEQILDMQKQASVALAAAEKDRAEAALVIVEAQRQRDELITAGKRKAGQLVHDAEVAAQLARANAKRIEDEAIVKQTKLTERETTVATRESNAKTREDAADAAHALATATRKEYEDHHARLKAALAHVG